MSLSSICIHHRSSTTCTLDIIAVHGLSDDAIETWSHAGSGAHWLRDFLPRKVDDVRILLFTYDATAAFSQSITGIVVQARRLLRSMTEWRSEGNEKERSIIFVAHSLGGIVVKQALIQAQYEPRYSSIRDASIGVLFFGTPHQENDKMTYGSVLANVARKLSYRPLPTLINALENNSDELQQLNTHFKVQSLRYHIVSFYEQRPIHLDLVVEKQSVLLDVEHEDAIPVYADHRQMCKFEKDDDDTFQTVWKKIEQIRKQSRPTSSTKSISHNQHFRVPHHLDPLFTGRERIGRRLDTAFGPSRSERLVQRRFVLYGVGGAGKTQTCLRYIQAHRNRYWGIFWIDATCRESIRQSLIRIGTMIGFGKTVNSVRQGLVKVPYSWLLVFDNADDPTVPLAEYFPDGEQGDIIILSQNKDCQKYHTVGCEELGKMAEEDAKLLLCKTAYGKDDLPGTQADMARRLISVLGHLALALAQAGAYIRETSCTMEEYLQIYYRRQIELKTSFPEHSDTDFRHAVYTTCQMSIDKISLMLGDASTNALKMIRLMCFYHHDCFPLEAFFQAWKSTVESPEEAVWLPWPKMMTNSRDFRHSFQATMILLSSFSLLKRGTNNSLSFHSSIHEWCRKTIEEDERYICCQRAIILLGRSVPWAFTTADYKLRGQMVPHVLVCVRHWNEMHGCVEQGTLEDWAALALVLSENGTRNNSLESNTDVVRLRKYKLGADHPDTLVSMCNLAAQYSEAGRQVDALNLGDEILRLMKHKLGASHPDTIAWTNNLSNRYSEAGRQEHAMELGAKVFRLRERKLGMENPDTLVAMSNLAVRYSEAGRREDALKLGEEVVGLMKDRLGADHHDTLSSMSNLAVRYSEAGRQEDALKLGEEVVGLMKDRLGADNHNTLSAMSNLAVRYSEAGRQEDALKLGEEVMQLMKCKLGVEHPDTLTSMSNLVFRYHQASRHGDALQLGEEVLRLSKLRLGADHPDTLTFSKNVTYLRGFRSEQT